MANATFYGAGRAVEEPAGRFLGRTKEHRVLEEIEKLGDPHKQDGGSSMSKNSRWWIVLAIIVGFMGGVVTNRVATFQPVFAQESVKPTKVIEAEEFRLVDRDGNTRARLTIRDGKVFAEIPDLSKWTVKLLQGARAEQ